MLPRSGKFLRTGVRSQGDGCLIPFALAWIAFSMVFVGIGIFAAMENARHAQWPEVPCRIESFAIQDEPSADEPFATSARFIYTVNGREYTGTRTFAGDKDKPRRFDDFKDLEEFQARFKPGTETTCHVNPLDPADAFLVRKDQDAWLGLIFAAFGSLFSLIGVGLLVHGIKSWRAARRAATTGLAQTESRRAGDSSGWLMVPFFSVFGLAGIGVMIGFVMPMWQKYFAAQSWTEVPATVLWSKVRSHTGDDSTTYSAQIFYSYEFGGETYRSDTPGFLDGSSSGYKAKEEKVRAHPPGKEIRVWVNPEKPWQAVRDRSLGAWAWFSLFPLPFIAVGVGGLLYWTRRKAREAGPITAGARPAPARPGGLPGSIPEATAPSLRLEPGKNRLGKLLLSYFVALFWNGIVSVFVFVLWDDWKSGEAPWFLALFLVPFVAVGIGLILAALHQTGAIFNPRPILTLTPGTPRLGQSLSIQWEVPSGAGRLKDLRVLLRGEEIARSGSGDDARTDRSTFFERELAAVELPELIARGFAGFRLPDDLVPTWKQGDNAIEWTLEVRGRIAFWPDIADRHTLHIHPASI